MNEDREWGEGPVVDVKLSAEQYKDLITRVTDASTNRNIHTADMKEDDFACGAMAVMECLGIACPTWPLLIMAGEKIFVKKEEAK